MKPLLESHASRDFWDCYDRLPMAIQHAADKQFALLDRARANREKNAFFWFWIGSHDEYERLVGQP